MKFYIFGNTVKNKEICCSAKKAAFISDDFETALYRFRDYINEIRFTNCYLLVDFETAKKNTSSFSAIGIDNDFEKIMPFFIIGEWHVGEDKNSSIRKDHTILTKNGFVHEFMNNETVVRDLIYCLNNHIQFTLEIVYAKIEDIKNYDFSERREFRRIIVDSIDIIRNKGYSIKKFKITPINWEVPPINRVLRLYKLEKMINKHDNPDYSRELFVMGESM